MANALLLDQNDLRVLNAQQAVRLKGGYPYYRKRIKQSAAARINDMGYERPVRNRQKRRGNRGSLAEFDVSHNPQRR
ncbi:MAG: hypothetical protein LBC29_03895, partial [Propionibacteriaceae bacterium]|nr:hypothetical protein [Propionibacteriaceae bacterium]